MKFKQKIIRLKESIDKEIERIFNVIIRDAQKKDPLIAEALQHVKKIALSGGKRIRGALLCQAYIGFGGKEKRKIIKVAAAIELVHLFLLMHDDIIDRGGFRHGEMTLHKMLEKKYQKKYGREKAVHFGDSMAIIVGDMLYAKANGIIVEAGFENLSVLAALTKLQSIVSTTIIGQSQDINISYNSKLSQSQILSMYENKTARYTFEGPLHMGAILAGCKDKKSFDLLGKYALSLGIAFQIQDDILGVFGSEKIIGKSAASDIEEGKKTLIVSRAYEEGSAEQKMQLDSILGKSNLGKKEISLFKNILLSTGAKEYGKKMSIEYFKQGKDIVEKIIILSEAKNFLIGLIEYLEKRNA